MDLLNENIALNIPSLSDNEDKSSDGSSNNSVSSQQNIDDVNDEHFETADSGLSSDTVRVFANLIFHFQFLNG